MEGYLEHKMKFKELEHMGNIATHRREIQIQRERDEQAAKQSILYRRKNILDNYNELSRVAFFNYSHGELGLTLGLNSGATVWNLSCIFKPRSENSESNSEKSVLSVEELQQTWMSLNIESLAVTDAPGVIFAKATLELDTDSGYVLDLLQTNIIINYNTAAPIMVYFCNNNYYRDQIHGLCMHC